MKLITMFIVLALTSSPMPKENYYASISPEIADEIIECILCDEYRQHIDFNGDGKLSIADVVGVSKRYFDNCTYGNKITIDNKVVDSIVTENYSEAPIYWEVYRVGDNNCRAYEVSVSEITEISLWIEFENYGETVNVIANPFTETVTVID